MRNSHKLA